MRGYFEAVRVVLEQISRDTVEYIIFALEYWELTGSLDYKA
jgi:hypothetical protein